MEMLNRGASDFRGLLRKLTKNRVVTNGTWRGATAPASQAQEIAAWNAEVDRRRAEKKARKMAAKGRS